MTEPAQLPNGRVLVIDDTLAIHDDFRKILCTEVKPEFDSLEAEILGQQAPYASGPRFEVTSAYQGQEGLETVRASVQTGKPFALAFVDVRMPPGWDGVETTARLWEADPNLQIVICTAHSDYSWEEMTARLGHSERLLILKKPFDVIEVLQLAHTLTEKWRLAHESKAILCSLEGSVQERTKELRGANQELSKLAAERQLAAQRLERVNRLYSVLSKVNELIVRGRAVDSLLQETCRVLVEDGFFRLAWFGVLDQQSLLVRPTAWAGNDAGYLSQVQVLASPDSPHGAGPSGRALVEGCLVVCNDIASDPAMQPWREAALTRGFAASAAFPVKTDTRTLGILSLYSAEPNFFRQAELELLNRLSDDLSFALQYLEQAGRLRLQSAALTAAENGIVITDPDAVILWHNPAFSQLTGFSAEEAVGRKMSLLKSGKQPPEFYQELWRTISSGQPWQGEIVNRRKDGRLFTSEATITPMHDPQGAVTHYIAIQHDVTARKQAEERTAAFATLGQRLNIANTTQDAARIIVEVADLLLGWDSCLFQLYSPAENLVSELLVIDLIQGRRTECQVNTAWRPPLKLAKRAIREGGLLLLQDNPVEAQSDGVPFGDTSRRSASILFVPIRNGSQATGVLSIQSYAPKAYDQASLDTLQALADHCGGAIDRIKSQETLRHTQEQLRQSQKLEAIGQLAGGVAHDFNNLLAVIRGNADLVLLQPNQLQAEGQECLHQITAAAERAAKLTNQLLIFSRKQVMQSRPINLNDLVSNLTKMLKRIIGEHINLQCSYVGQPPFAQADAGMLEQVLVNLVVNARDAMPSGGRLVLSTGLEETDAAHVARQPEARTGLFAVLSVEDSGTGIAPELLPRIFEPFFTTKDVGKGSGLGLSTVYGIVKQHRGWIEVNSQLGAGATFTIYLPALQQPTLEKEREEAPGIPQGGSERILLVEDEDGVRKLTRTVLEKFGYRVREAASGGQALEECADRAGEFDLLLTDMVMPGGITGRELAEKLRNRNPELKVLCTSGYSGDALGPEMEFLRCKHTRFVSKPCSSRQLLQAVRQCLDDAQPDESPPT
ncbi:putative Histidine kinase [Verrucomicrobia bacterium]|nr:putative Histidine kinase [Verrucomicrobiota bacterium]